MTSEEFEALEEKYENDFHEFDRIPEADRLHPSYQLCGLLKVASLMRDPSRFGVEANHDILYLPDLDDLPGITEADALYLIRCGVHYDTGANCLAKFC